jgi:hypothetical protein
LRAEEDQRRYAVKFKINAVENDLIKSVDGDPNDVVDLGVDILRKPVDILQRYFREETIRLGLRSQIRKKEVPDTGRLQKGRKLGFSENIKEERKQTIPESLYLLHFTESLDDTQVTRKYPEVTQKPANPELLVFVGSHTST